MPASVSVCLTSHSGWTPSTFLLAYQSLYRTPSTLGKNASYTLPLVVPSRLLVNPVTQRHCITSPPPNGHSTDATSEKPARTVAQRATPPAANDGEEHWGTVPEEPMLPPKYQNSFWSPEMRGHRQAYFKIMAPMVVMVIIVMWLVLPTYWGSLGEAATLVPNLKGYLVNRDSGALGQAMVQAFQQNTLGVGVTHNAHQTWIVLDQSTLTNQRVEDAVFNEVVWNAVIVDTDVTARAITARSNGDASYNGSLAITHIYNQGRNEQAANGYIVPLTTALLTQSLAKFNAEFTGQYLSYLSGGGETGGAGAGVGVVNATALAALARAPSTVTMPFGFTAMNLRPFTKPVSTALLLVGNIYITIFAFIVALAHDSARGLIHPYLRYRSYLSLRLIAPLLFYAPVSFAYAMVSLPFHVTFGERYSYAGGFFLLWVFVYMGMAAQGLAVEAMVTVLTARFVSFFLMFLIIYNVSSGTLPIALQPAFYKWGYGFPIYNLSIAIRTIIFDTKSHLGRNAGVLVAWILLSVGTIALFTWVVRRGEVRREEGEVQRRREGGAEKGV